MSVRYASSSLDLRGSYTERMEHHDPIEVVISSFFGSEQQCHLICFDIMHMCFRRCDVLRETLASQLHCRPEQIIVHCTHTHTGPRDEDLQHDRVLPLLLACIKEHAQRAETVHMAYTAVDTHGRWNVNRRIAMPHAMGKCCLWAGGVETADGHFDGTRVIQRRLQDWFGEDFSDPDFDGPFHFDEDERDTLLQLLVFNNAQGQTVGSIIRFACHPAIAGHTTNRRYSADFPGFTRRLLAERRGGVHMWLTGPCGNITAREHGTWQELSPGHVASMLPLGPHQDPEACYAEGQRIASEIADTIDAHYPQDDAFEALDSIDLQLQQCEMRLREDLYSDLESATAAAQAIWQALEQRQADYARHKLLADQYMFLEYHRQFIGQGYLTPTDIRQGSIDINMPAVRLNNTIIQGCPGESFWELPQAAAAVAEQHGSQFISFSFANGEVTYLPTAAERTYGDYETCYCIAHVDGVQEIERQILLSTEALIERSPRKAAT